MSTLCSAFFTLPDPGREGTNHQRHIARWNQAYGPTGSAA